ncbi:MAG: hypothetical protein K1X55_11695 [Chitinophagales bacterium]|nr:hypothetical protein [Chitinophagales bacterium]
MKIYYFAIIGSSGALGIMKKVMGKVKTLNELGYNAEGVFLFHSDEPLPKTTPQTHFITYAKLQQQESYLKIAHFIEKTVLPEDKLVMRYPLANEYLLHLTAKFPKRIWLEHNTMEIEELQNNFKKLSMRDWLYIFSRWYFTDIKENWQFLQNEKKYFTQVAKNAAGGIGVTKEICDYEIRRSGGNYTCKLVGNGIKVDEIDIKPPLPFDGKQLHLLMMSTTANDWHGTDRMIEGMANYSGETRITLTLVGNFTSKTKELIQKYHLDSHVRLLPKTFGVELTALLHQAHIGIGSLGMHRLGLKEGSVLKVKEYMAMGMPFIIGHDEIDLINKPEFEPFYFQAPANDTPIDVAALVDFAKKVFSIEHLEDKIRNFALENIDMKVKMKELATAIME